MDNSSLPDTRGRSRSKTPFLRSSCDRELCAHAGEDHVHEHKKSPVKKGPRVQTIIEESVQESPEVRKVRTTRKVVTQTSDYSSEDTSPEHRRAEMLGKSVNESITVVSNIQTVTSQVAASNENVEENIANIVSPIFETSSRGLISRIKSILANDAKTNGFETSTPKNVNQTKKLRESKTNGSTDPHISYKVYKEAGEYWNKYPKTDYTYSRLSPHRRELAPGIVAMPNISRQSLLKHHERVNLMAQRNPELEAYIRKRYESTYHTSSADTRKEAYYYDSQDEVDLSENKRSWDSLQKDRYSVRTESIFTRFFTSILTVFTRITSVFSTNEKTVYGARLDNNKGFLEKVVSVMSWPVLYVFRHVYTLITSLLYLDTLLLRSSSADNVNKKRFLLFLLLLLPLSIIGASYLQKNEMSELPQLHAILPESVIGFQSAVKENWNKVIAYDYNNMLPSLNWLPMSSSGKYESVTDRFEKSLDPESFSSLKRHIDGYIEQLVEEKISKERAESLRREQQINQKISLLISQAIRGEMDGLKQSIELSNQRYEPQVSDIQRIVDLVKVQMENSGLFSSRYTLSQENMKQISNLIKLDMEENFNNVNVSEKFDVEKLLLQILKSPAFDEYIIMKFDILSHPKQEATERLKLTINQLTNEISSIKTQLAEKLLENENLQNSINSLKEDQDGFLLRLNNVEQENKLNFANLLLEIETKVASLRDDQFSLINKQIKLALVEILGYKNGKNINDVDLQNWVRNMFVAKEFLEARLLEISERMDQSMKNEIDRSGMILLKEITDKVKQETLVLIEDKNKELAMGSGDTGMSLSEIQVKQIVKDALAVYDADKTGLVDYALESAGGQVLSTRCTETYQTKTAQLRVFGIPLWYPSNTPRVAISPAVQPGECWAFQGFPGFLVLKLNTMIFVNGFTLEHIPKSLSPKGSIDSAPKEFTVWGLNDESDQDPVLFGKYKYEDNNVALQYFAVQNKNIARPFDIVELRIESNHGNELYTCLYRFRVHGSPAG